MKISYLFNERATAAGLLVGCMLSGFLLGLAPFVVCIAGVLLLPESKPDLAIGLVMLYEAVLLLPVAVGYVVGRLIDLVMDKRSPRIDVHESEESLV